MYEVNLCFAQDLWYSVNVSEDLFKILTNTTNFTIIKK